MSPMNTHYCTRPDLARSSGTTSSSTSSSSMGMGLPARACALMALLAACAFDALRIARRMASGLLEES